MLPHSLSETNVSLGRPSFMEAEYDENEINDYFNDNGVILEDEEEYDVLNDETFGEPLGDEPNDLEIQPSWEEYDSHNDETFGEEISFDWEAEHEKMVSVLEEKDENASKLSDINETVSKKLQHKLKSETVNKNGFCKIGSNKSYLEHVDLDGAIQEDNSLTNGMMKSLHGSKEDKRIHDAHNDSPDDVNGFTDTLTNALYDKLSLGNDTWHYEPNDSHFIDSIEQQLKSYSQDYSLFSSGTNLLQNAGIHIPSVPKTTSHWTIAPEDLEKKVELQSSASSIPSVADLEKQWLNDAFSKKVITADSFGAYDSAFYVNNSSSPSSTNNASGITITQVRPPPEPSFMKSDKTRKHYPLFMNASIPFAQQAFPPPPSSSMMNGEGEAQSLFAKLNAVNRLPPPQFDHKSFPVPIMTDSGIMMYDDVPFRNAPNFGDMNAQTVGSFVNNNALNRAKTHPGMDPSVIMSSDNIPRLSDTSMLIDSSNLSRLGINVFQPPPGLTIDPAKFRHFQHTVGLQTRPPQITSCLALQPIQVLNGITPDEQQKQLMKFQKEERLSVVDEYAGMMTEREKYWLAGVQLLQINAMDPFKDDYYFTNYQARRRGNRGKSQTNNNNNKKWQNEHTKDYLPLQFENSLGKVQVGSVVAPRKVIDTDVFESSPKHSGKLNDSLSDDPMANTSHRKRRAIMLHIENLYGKIIALETLQVNSAKNKTDPATVKIEFEGIVNALKEDIINLKDDFKIIMSIKKGKRLVLKLLMFCDNPEAVWFQIFEILERIIRGDQEHCMLLSYLPYFRTWLTTIDLATMKRLSNYLMMNLNFYLRDKFSVSVMANMIEQAELMYVDSRPEDQTDWMEFIVNLARNAHQSLEDIQKPVVSVKPQTLRSHLLKCEKLENGYVSNLLKIFSNNMRKP